MKSNLPLNGPLSHAHTSESLSAAHMREQFWVVAILNNPMRFKRRHQLFNEFITRMKNYQVNLCVVEIAYGDRNFETDSGPAADVPIKVQLRSDTILWHKENMINIGISRLPNNWKYVAWIDTDIDFMRPDWVDETIHQLQHHAFVQLFEDAIDLGPNSEVMNTYKGFVYCYKNKVPPPGQVTIQKVNGKKTTITSPYYPEYDEHTTTTVTNGTYWHSGYAWAATREAINTVGGLIDFAILGSGDHHMAWSLIGKGRGSLPNTISTDYKEAVLHWEQRALRLHKDISYIKGTIFHHWHGKKADRRYKERWQILTEDNFRPSYDLYKDWQGLLTFYHGAAELRDDIYTYFEQRNEDSVER